MLVADLAARIMATVPALAGRVQGAAEFSELARQGAWPQASPAGFVLPLGLAARTEGDAATGAFTQMVDELFGVLIVVRASGDVTGAKALPAIDELVWAAIEAIGGWAPASSTGSEAVGVFHLVRGGLVGANAGRVIYQLDFGLQQQVRVIG